MTDTPPVAFEWDGEAMIPVHPRLADKHFVVGERYSLVQHEDRSAVSHRHFFASVNEAHQNLPEDLALRFPTSEALRKFALIKAGFRDERSIVCSSRAEAMRFKAFLQPMDDFALIDASGPVVTVYTAKSQSQRAMGKAEFQRSKEAALQVISEMIGTDAATLHQNAGMAA